MAINQRIAARISDLEKRRQQLHEEMIRIDSVLNTIQELMGKSGKSTSKRGRKPASALGFNLSDVVSAASGTGKKRGPKAKAVKKGKRGRPAKNAAAPKAAKPAGKRGRPAKNAAAPKVAKPAGKRGRPAKNAAAPKVAKPAGKRGRPAKNAAAPKVAKPAGKRGRPAKNAAAPKVAKPAGKRGRPAKNAAAPKAAKPAGKRGRPAKNAAAPKAGKPAGKRGRPAKKAAAPKAAKPAGKRGRPAKNAAAPKVAKPAGKRGRPAKKAAPKAAKPAGKPGRPAKSASKKAAKPAKAAVKAKTAKPAKADDSKRGRPSADSPLKTAALSVIMGSSTCIPTRVVVEKLGAKSEFAADAKAANQFKSQVTTVLNDLFKKGQIKKDIYGDAKRDSAWGNPAWFGPAGLSDLTKRYGK